MPKIIVERNNEIFVGSATEIRNAYLLKALADKDSLKIAKMLAKEELTAQQIANKTSLNLQKIYYILRKLEKAGVIKVKRTEYKRGSTLKYYVATVDNILIRIADFEKAFFKDIHANLSEKAKEFLEPFIHNNVLNATIVIGSPDPHGKLKARARDADLAAQLSFFLGLCASNYATDIAALDTELASIEKLNRNLIVIGGPITNRIAMQLNKYAKLKFKFKRGKWIIESKLSNKEYDEDSIGIVEKMKHPFFKEKSILLIAGRRNIGTKASVFAMLNYLEEIAEGNKYNKNIKARVIEGLDRDADGRIDSIEFLE